MLVTIIELGGAYALGISSGAIIFRSFRREPISLVDVQKYMNRVVNTEEAEERYNLTRKALHDANRRTMPRSDSGAPAKVYRMRRRRVIKRR